MSRRPACTASTAWSTWSPTTRAAATSPPGPWRRPGSPVIEADNVDTRTYDGGQVSERVGRWLEEVVLRP
ncbi:hypothetical protein [Nonomuraea insulae]|uniref:Uncharacterized protein n=1 Tax=Nonomuraea insulae TaxID=1616787 RepID=A0ABW1CPH3_9ACTN